MNENCKVPLPIKLNCWKHHAIFIKNELSNINNELEFKQLHYGLLKIGESQMDLYCGKTSPEEIANQINNFLTSNLIKTGSEYLKWLRKNGKDYQSITLKDKSVWTLRHGDEEERFVHIHPGRYSPHTVRVKALTLKTAICVLAYSKIKLANVFDIKLINEARKEYLNASPLKSVIKETGLGKLLTLFNGLN